MAVIYVHLEADTGNPFYVGIGKTEKRAFNLKARSLHHKNVAAKRGVRVEIVHDELTWDAACWWEQRWIKALRGAGYRLVNMTDGGEGALGRQTSEKFRTKMSGKNNPSKRPEVRAKQSAAMLARGENNPMKRPEARAKMSANNPSKRPEARAKNSAAKKAYWAARKEIQNG